MGVSGRGTVWGTVWGGVVSTLPSAGRILPLPVCAKVVLLAPSHTRWFPCHLRLSSPSNSRAELL